MVEIFTMDWRKKEECARNYEKWSNRQIDTYISLADDYDGVWSVCYCSKVVPSLKATLFTGYHSGYITYDTETQRVNYHSNASSLKNFIGEKEHVYLNLDKKDRLSLRDKLVSGDVGTLTPNDVNTLLEMYDFFQKERESRIEKKNP